MVRAKSDQTVVVVEPGTNGNESPEAITVSFPTAHRFNVTGQTDDFMIAERVYESLHGMTTAKLVNTAIASFIGFTGATSVAKKDGQGRVAKTIKVGEVEMAEKEAKTTLMDLYLLAQKDNRTKAENATLVAGMKAMNLNPHFFDTAAA